MSTLSPGMVAAVQTFGELAHWQYFACGKICLFFQLLKKYRILKLSDDGHVAYKAEHDACRRFPGPASRDLKAGVSRNFQVFDALDFFAEVTQHIPDTGEHTIRYYGWCTNKSRGVRAKLAVPEKNIEVAVDTEEEDTPFRKTCRSKWAALIKKVYEIDPLVCPKCGGQMRIMSFIESRTK